MWPPARTTLPLRPFHSKSFLWKSNPSEICFKIPASQSLAVRGARAKTPERIFAVLTAGLFLPFPCMRPSCQAKGTRLEIPFHFPRVEGVAPQRLFGFWVSVLYSILMYPYPQSARRRLAFSRRLMPSSGDSLVSCCVGEFLLPFSASGLLIRRFAHIAG